MHISELVYNEYGAKLYRYALMILADRSMAEDTIQLVFMKFIKSGKEISELKEVYFYLRKAVRNESYKLLKKNSAHENLKISYAQTGLLEPKSKDSCEQQQEIVETAIRKLPPLQREVIHMKVYEKMTYKEIAGLLDESINTIASRYQYAIEKLKVIIPDDARETLYG